MKTLPPHEIEALVAAGDIDVVDVRDGREYASGHIPGARHLPLDELRANPKGGLPRDHVVFVCAKGIRSATACKIAIESAGLTDVYHLEGGILAWATAGLPIVVPEAPSRGASSSSSSSADADQDAGAACGIDEAGLEGIVGANLRELRAKRELSLDALSRMAGVARTTLGQIELGRTPPSIGVIWKIAQALGVPFSMLLRTSGPVGTTVLRRASGKRLLSSDGRFSSRALFPFGEPRKVEFYELWLAPHGVEDAEAHQPGTREYLVVASGRLELKVGADSYTLGKGDAIVFAADVAHSYKNPDGEECWMHLVMTYTDAVT